MPAVVEIALLGRFRVCRAGREVPAAAFGGRQPRLLLRVLAASRGTVVTREMLIEALWSRQPPADPGGNLNVVVNRARRALGTPSMIETAVGGYLLRSGPDVAVDAERVVAAVGAAASSWEGGDARATLRAVTEALALWQGEPLPEDTYAPWAAAHRDRLAGLHADALELGARAALAVGDAARARALAVDAVTRRPLGEAPRLLVARAMGAGGDRAGALATLAELRRVLAEELGIDPCREATELQLRLLRDDGSTDTTTGAPPGAPVDTSTGPATGPATGPSAGRRAAPFTGRDRELSRLGGLGTGGGERVALVAGRAGSGKSRLLAELAAGSDRRVLAARAVLPERVVPWSLARALCHHALTSIGGLTGMPGPALGPHAAAALGDLLGEHLTGAAATGLSGLDPSAARGFAVEAAARVLAAPRHALVIVDDLQWADASSLDVLAVAIAREPELVAVLAYRPEELAAHPEVAGFLADLRAGAHPAEIALGRLDAAAIGRIVDDDALAALLAEATDGTPFAVLEVLRAIEHAGLARVDDRGRWVGRSAEVPDRARVAARAGQQRAVLARAERVPPAAARLLGVLALLGRPAPERLLTAITGAGAPELGEALDALGHAELVGHHGGGFTTAHDLVAETVRGGLDPIERARMHRRIAEALAGEPEAAGERAAHLAGAGDRSEAARVYAEAARGRAERFAHREAGRLAQAGLDLHPDEPVRAALLDVRATGRERDGDRDGARADLRAALAGTGPGPARSRLLSRLAALAAGDEELSHAAGLVDLALAAAGRDPSARARALAVGAIVDMNSEQPQRAQARYGEALGLYERIGDAGGVADILDAQAMSVFLDGDIDAGIARFDRVARLFAEAGDMVRVVTPRSTRGHGLVFAARPEAALVDTAAAVDLARSLGYPEGEAYACWHHSEALSAAGRVAEAAEVAGRSVSAARRIGHRGWTAMAMRALGIAREAAGDTDGARAAFDRSLSAAGGFPLAECWAHARLALLLLRCGQTEQAGAHVDLALCIGPPLGRYEARLARCALAVARSEPDTDRLIADACRRAAAGGHHAGVADLAVLGTRAP